MSATILPFGAAIVESDRRNQFLEQVAASFDSYVGAHRQEPDAIVLTLCGVKQPASTYWAVRGPSEGSAGAVLSVAAVALLKVAQEP